MFVLSGISTSPHLMADVRSDSISDYFGLDEIVVTARRKASTAKVDGISYIPSAMIGGATGNMYEVINTIPGVTIHADGQVFINGLNRIAVYIDGRKSILNGLELLNYLKSILVSDIAKIEINYFDGVHTGGDDPVAVLNLIRNRTNDAGYTSGINVDGQLYRARQFYGSVFGEYKKLGHRVKLTYSAYVAHNPSELLTDRPYLEYAERLTQVYNRCRHDEMHHAAFSYEYTGLSNLIFGTEWHYNYFDRKETAEMLTSAPLNTYPSRTTNDAEFKTNNIYGELYIKGNKRGNDWITTCDFFKYKNDETQLMNADMAQSIHGSMLGNTFGIVGAIDANRDMSPQWTLSVGGRCSYVKLKSSGEYFNAGGLEAQSEIHELGSSFGYEENVNALYAEGKAAYGRVRTSIGLRAEQTNYYTYFSGNESAVKRDISRHKFNLYPSVSVIMTTKQTGTWALSYTSKIIRPAFSDLDPFIHLFDDITHVGGNINLKEARMYSFGAVWSDNVRFRVALQSEYSTDEIVKCYRELTDKVVYVTPENLPEHFQLVLSMSGNEIGLRTWWNVSATANIIYSTYHFPESISLSPNKMVTPMIDVKNTFNLPYNLVAELAASWRGPMAYGQVKISSVLNSNLSVRKTFLSNKLSVTFYVKDLLNTNHFTSHILLYGRKASLSEKEFEDMRKIGLSVSFQLSGGSKNSRDESRNVWIEELNRVNL